MDVTSSHVTPHTYVGSKLSQSSDIAISLTGTGSLPVPRHYVDTSSPIRPMGKQKAQYSSISVAQTRHGARSLRRIQSIALSTICLRRRTNLGRGEASVPGPAAS